MERRKKKEKPMANGSSAEGAPAQSGDGHQWHRDAGEQQGSANKLTSSTTSDSPTQHSALPSFNWSFVQHPSMAQQQPMHAMTTQSLGQTLAQQHAAALQGSLQGPSLHPVSQLGWQNPDGFAHSAAPTHATFQSGGAESSWQHAAAAAATVPQNLGGRPPPFPFPVPPYPGPWDPVSWWRHNPYHPPFPYMYPGFGSGYSCPMPATPPIGGNQRGLIKPPPGLSQKHHRIWEAQSMENMQLWTTTTQLWAAVARSDAEIALQRTKILKLEADLQMIKAQRDGNMPHSEATAGLKPSSKRGRRKKATPAPAPLVTTANVASPDSNALRAPATRNARLIIGNADPAINVKEMALEEERSKLGNHSHELVYRPSMDDRDQKSCSLNADSLRNESALPQKHTFRQTLEFQSSANNPLTVGKDDIAFGHLNHLSSPFRPSSLIAGRKDGGFEHTLKEGVAAVSLLKNASNLDHQSVISAAMPFAATMNTAGLCPDTKGNMMAKEAVVRSQYQAHFNRHSVENSIPHGLQKPWQDTGEDGSDDQEEGVASAQEDDDGEEIDDDDDDDNTLDGIQDEKVGNLWHSIPFR